MLLCEVRLGSSYKKEFAQPDTPIGSVLKSQASCSFRQFPSSSKSAKGAVSVQVSCKKEIRILKLKITPQGKKKTTLRNFYTNSCLHHCLAAYSL